jgi:hypothetical protein
MRFHVRGEHGVDGPYQLDQLRDMLDRGAVSFYDAVWLHVSSLTIASRIRV